MAKTRSPNRDRAYGIYEEYNGKITSKEIARKLDEKLSNISSWRTKDHWKEKLKGKVGAPYNNKNAVGNNGGAPEKNMNNYKHGFYSKYLPKQTYDIFQSIEEMSPIDILWNNIKIKYAAILRAQKIMYVKNNKDLTKELKKSKVKSNNRKTEKADTNSLQEEFEYQLQFAWDKQERFLNAQSQAMNTLTKMIKEYEELLHKNWNLASEEQKLRVEKLKAEINVLTINDDNENEKVDDGFIQALNSSAREDWSDEDEEE